MGSRVYQSLSDTEGKAVATWNTATQRFVDVKDVWVNTPTFIPPAYIFFECWLVKHINNISLSFHWSFHWIQLAEDEVQMLALVNTIFSFK
jgi:hypothetical protein